MLQKSRFVKMVSVLSVLAMLVSGLIVSCSNSSNNETPTVTYSSAGEATGGASSAKASVDLSSAMSEAATGLSSFSNSSGYSAPGKGGSTTTDTSSIANIDPKLKKLVDGMLASMKSPAVKNAVSKARANKAKVSMAAGPGTPGSVIYTGLCSGGTGTFTITGTDSSDLASTYVEYTIDIRFDSCRDVADPAGIYSVTTGTIHAYDKEITGNTNNTRNATIDLVAEKYDSLDAPVETDTVKATFTGADSGSSTSRIGRNTASGSFSGHEVATNETGTFYFTNMVSDWTWDLVSGVETVENTANGNFGLHFVDTSPQQTFTLNIGLSNLINKVEKNIDPITYPSWKQWVNGSVTISWSPEALFTAVGCKSGRITFTTAEATPLQFDTLDSTCPSSGTLQVNNATIVYYGPDDPTHIVITVGTDSLPLVDCSTMKGGLCS